MKHDNTNSIIIIAYYFNEDYTKVMDANYKIIKGSVIQMVICRVGINKNSKANIDICLPENKNYNSDKKALHYIQACVGASFWSKAEWIDIPRPDELVKILPPINEKGSYTFSRKQRIEEMPLNITKLKIWPYFCYPTDGNNIEIIKRDGKPITFEISLPAEIQSFSLKVNTFFHNIFNNNQLSLQVSYSITIKSLKNMIIEKIDRECIKDNTHSWTRWTVNLFDDKYSRLCDDISNEDDLELRDCLKTGSGMTINVVINRISLDGFPKTDDIRWPPVTSLNDEVIYFVSAGFQGYGTISYTGYLYHLLIC